MKLLLLIALFLVALSSLMLYRRVAVNRASGQRDARLVERQQAIQFVIDKLGLTLKDSNTTVQEGEDAMRTAREELLRLEDQGDLSELIADNEQFFDEWRESRMPGKSS